MEKIAKLFARTKQTLKPEVEAPVVAANSTSIAAQVPPSGLDLFPELVFAKSDAQKGVAKDSTFLQRTSLLFELTRRKQNRQLFMACSVFLGLVVFTHICAPFFSLGDQMQFSALNPPQLAGTWNVNDVSDSVGEPHVISLSNVQQRECELTAKGTDEFGDFELTGTLTPPNKIHLVKIHDNAQLHDTQIMDGEIKLDGTPLYAHGSWSRAHAIDATKESLSAEGYWDANFYSTNPQPKFAREGMLRTPAAVFEFLTSGRVSDSDKTNTEKSDGAN